MTRSRGKLHNELHCNILTFSFCDGVHIFIYGVCVTDLYDVCRCVHVTSNEAETPFPIVNTKEQWEGTCLQTICPVPIGYPLGGG